VETLERASSHRGWLVGHAVEIGRPTVAPECMDKVETKTARLREQPSRKWLPRKDLNLDKQNQNLLCYRYTTGQQPGVIGQKEQA
jgi:hypothetical protein